MIDSAKDSRSERLLEWLVIDEVTQGLSRSQQAERDLLMGELRRDEPGLSSSEGLERAATAIDFAFALESRGHSGSTESAPASRQVANTSVPPSLERRLSELARDFDPAVTGGQSSVVEFPGSRLSERSPRGTGIALGWALAAAASLLALVGWWPRITPAPLPTETVVEDPVGPIGSTIAPIDPTALVRVTLQGTEDPSGVGATGLAEWSSETQSGRLRIAGLASNDPAESQYQLWIFDRDQDERYPIDGGVFDFPALGPGETVEIPIDAKIAVGTPTLFAITVERPGGVVVSGRERIVLAGSVV